MTEQRTMLAMLAGIAEGELTRHGEPVSADAGDHARHPARRISLEEGLEAWRRLPAVMRRASIGLDLAAGGEVAAFHHLGVAFASAPHLLAAIQVFCRYFLYLCQADHVFEYSLDGETVIGWDDDADVAPRSLRDFILAEIAVAVRHYGWQPVAPVRAELAGVADDEVERYRRAFQCPVRIGVSRSRLVYDTACLAQALRGSNPDLHHQMTLRLAADDGAARSVARRTVGAIEQSLDRGHACIERAAEQLGLSVRTLQYQLSCEGYRFSDLLRRVRQRRALHLLCETTVPIRSIAFALGYTDAGSFQRAFREWYGLRPRDFRDQHCDH